MLKEQFLEAAMKALSQAYETRERLKEALNNDVVRSYIQGMKDFAIHLLEKSNKGGASPFCQEPPKRTPGRKPKPKDPMAQVLAVKKERKSSIKPAKDIGSLKADKISEWLKATPAPKLKKNDAIDGKKSLAYLVWALGHAERADIKEGISIHDVSALLFKMNKIELYPINFSRVVHANTKLISQVGQVGRTKTYLLTPEGKTVFEARFL